MGSRGAKALPMGKCFEILLRNTGLSDELFPSAAFRAWLAKVSSVLPLSWAAEARRFRPALDYTLATSEESEARLDVVLGLTRVPQRTAMPYSPEI